MILITCWSSIIGWIKVNLIGIRKRPKLFGCNPYRDFLRQNLRPNKTLIDNFKKRVAPAPIEEMKKIYAKMAVKQLIDLVIEVSI